MLPNLIGMVAACIIAWISIYMVLKTEFINHIDNRMFRIFGAIAVGEIAFLIFGFPLPSYLPLVTMIAGIVGGAIIKFQRRWEDGR